MNDEDSAYNTYRAALRSANEQRYRNPDRAGARRQKARQVTVERHNISYQALKAIIKEKDKALGIIEHPKGPPDASRKLRMQAATTAWDKASDKDTCPDCQETKPGNVQVRFNPKSMQRAGDEPEFVTCCYSCYFSYQGKLN